MSQKLSDTIRWIPLNEIQQYFNYKPTQLANLLKDETLIVAKVGKKKFVKLDSLERFLEKKSK